MKKGTVSVGFCIVISCLFVFSASFFNGSLIDQMATGNPSFFLAYEHSIKIPNFLDKVPEMEREFDRQIADLRAKGFGEVFLTELMIMRTSVTVKAAKMDIGEGNVPFVPAINVSYGLSGKCGKPTLRYKDKKLKILNKKQFLGLGELFGSDNRVCPYYIFDVSPGHDMLGVSAQEAQPKISVKGRRTLNVIEGTFLFLLTDNIAKNGMWFAGSRCHGRVPVVYMKDGEVYIDAEDPNSKYQDRGVVSCVID